MVRSSRKGGVLPLESRDSSAIRVEQDHEGINRSMIDDKKTRVHLRGSQSLVLSEPEEKQAVDVGGMHPQPRDGR